MILKLNNQNEDGLSRNPSDDDLAMLEQECMESCDKETLSGILNTPRTHGCLAISADLLQYPASDRTMANPLSVHDLQKLQREDEVTGPVYQALSLGLRPHRKEWQRLHNKSRLLFHQWNKL